jgi:hypothetical protein
MIKEVFQSFLSLFSSWNSPKKAELKALDLEYRDAQKVKLRKAPLPGKNSRENKDISAI